MDLSKLSREDWVVGAGGIVLLIDLLFLPWHHESVGVGGVSISASQSATSSPDSIWGVLALLVTIAVVLDLALARFSPQTRLPTTQLGRDMTRTAAAGLALALLVLKLIVHTSYLGFGCYLGLVLAIAVVVAAYRTARGATAGSTAGSLP
jgi:hypothetical protein